MKKKQLRKYSVITTASFMTLQLAACGAPAQTSPAPQVEDMTKDVQKNMEEETNISPGTENNTVDDKVENVMDSDYSQSCAEWKEAEDGSAQCIDENSPYYSQHFFNGLMFATLGAMAGSAMYKTKIEKTKKNSNGVVVPPPVKPNNNNTNNNSSSTTIKNDTTTNPSKNTSNNGINLNKNNSNNSTSNSPTNSNNSNNSTSNSPTNSNNSNNSTLNPTTNSNNSNSGKSGFSSGGAGRGGSSGS
ncbi:hypothetical protein CSE16_12355 [Solibacillus sp. R5-41]|uniref:hypothetical protein n=1 Tax=Solibacillus sp. R5-41 TaxID=2048654 RepID=UPI000C127E6E|nr:hypothetical protein [Solibacillus sp. R5-41]ATP40777.1 hypothetical protein CSE16_12355 [Solibacillus sp. R5-41]